MGILQDPTAGPTGNAVYYRQVWVTLAVVLQHPLWGTTGLPIWSWLYVRHQDVTKLPKQFGWKFQTKLVWAVDVALRAARGLQTVGKLV